MMLIERKKFNTPWQSNLQHLSFCGTGLIQLGLAHILANAAHVTTPL